MRNDLGEIIQKAGITRRDFLRLTSISVTGVLIGCAVNPVTGRKQLMLISEDAEINIDKKNSPHQFSGDYGTLTDRDLNNYIDRTGKKMAVISHRPQMPYSFRGVNATYINAYAFPGGSIAVTRGILLSLDNEAELAGLLGHEIGHVNARHTAERMSKYLLTTIVAAGVTAYVQSENEKYASLAAGLGGIGAGMLLARYSRDDEREADALGMEYMVKAGHNPKGMVGLMDVLRNISKHKPNAIEIMFATHPMSEERYHTAKESSFNRYKYAQNLLLNRDRYMDHTTNLRRVKGAIEEMQNGEKMMIRQKFVDAETHFHKALKQAPRDYAGLVMMAKCQFAQKKYNQALRYTQRAKEVNPKEAQAYYISGMGKIMAKNFNSAYGEFTRYEKMLQGNPNTIFFKGLSQEGMQHRDKAAAEYSRFLQIVTSGEQAQYANQRLVDWGYIN